MKALVVVVLCACSFEDGTLSAGGDAGTGDVPKSDARPIDAPSVDARVCPAAPPTCTAFTCAGSSSCYYACGSSTIGKQTWTGARTSCANAGIGCIVTINDQAEQDCIAAQTMPVFPNNVWFGLRQDASGSEPQGGWDWECGSSTYAYPEWGKAEPNDQGGMEDCGILATGGGWNDANCGGTARFVCELP